jgi:hypothetical protein
LAVGLQLASGAYQAEFAAYPDEPSHVVNGIMLDQFLRDEASWGSPFQYAENYYLHYPKVTIGHWPPLLYVVQTAGTILARPSRALILMVQAVLAGILATVVFRLLTRQSGWFSAVVGTCALLLVRVVQIHTSMVMAEILLTLTMFLACLSFGDFAETALWGDAVLFAFWSAAAILTKGTGWALLMVPPLTICLTRRWRLLRSPALWCSVIIIAVLCVPWQIATLRLAAVGWDSPSPNLAYTWRAAVDMTMLMFAVPGPALTTLALLGVLFKTIAPWKANRVSPLAAALTALCFATWLFHVLVPAGTEMRKVIIAVPAIFVLAGYGAQALALRLVSPSRVSVTMTAIFSCVCLVGIAGSLPVEQKPRYGYIQTARALAEVMPTGSAALISSDAYGEGALISEMALLEPDPKRYIIRSTKFLAASTWSGQNYRLLATSMDDCGRLLALVPVSFIVFDLRPAIDNPDHLILRAYLDSHASKWSLVRKFNPTGSTRPGVALYALSQGARRVENLVIDLQPTIGRDLRFNP